MNTIRIRHLIKKCGLSRQTIYRRLQSDPSFPKSFSLGGSCVGWDEAEVDKWLESCKAGRHNGCIKGGS